MWNDITSYRQGDNIRKPTCFELKLSRYFRVCISYSHRGYPGEWIMHMHPLFQCTQLQYKKYEDIEDAKKEALKIAKTVLEDGLKTIK